MDTAPALDAHAGERFWEDLRSAVAHAVVGDEEALRLLAVALLADGHALIEDVPGVGKTLLARTFSKALGLGFARVQGTPDLLPGDVTGSSVYEAGTFRFIPGPVFTNVLLVDEINRATPRTQASLLEAMQERQVSDRRREPSPAPAVPGGGDREPRRTRGHVQPPRGRAGPVPRPRSRWATRTATPSSRSPGATRRPRSRSIDVTAVTDPAAILRLRDDVRDVTVSEDVLGYLVDLVRATRDHADLRFGASPRASVALLPRQRRRGRSSTAAVRGPGGRGRRSTGRARPPPAARLDRRLRRLAESVLEEVVGQVAIPRPEPA